MFGYFKAFEPELKIKEYTFYRSVYCGLCKSMGKCTGQCSRLSLNYDITLLAIIRLALVGDSIKISPKRCLIHPFKKRPVLKINPTLEYCSYASSILTYKKINDDVKDERGIRRLKAKILNAVFKLPYQRAKKRYPVLDDNITYALSKLDSLEKCGRCSIDEAATASGELLGDVFAYELDPSVAPIARGVGRYLGKWLYIIDALDDYIYNKDDENENEEENEEEE